MAHSHEPVRLPGGHPRAGSATRTPSREARRGPAARDGLRIPTTKGGARGPRRARHGRGGGAGSMRAPRTSAAPLLPARRRPRRRGGCAVNRRLRSRAWFDDPEHIDNTALYLERMLNYGLTLERAPVRPADHRDRADRLRHNAVQPAPSRARDPCPRRDPRGRRYPARVPDPSDPGDVQAPDGDALPQPAVSLPRRDPLRLSTRRRRADDRLRQDDARRS